MFWVFDFVRLGFVVWVFLGFRWVFVGFLVFFGGDGCCNCLFVFLGGVVLFFF